MSIISTPPLVKSIVRVNKSGVISKQRECPNAAGISCQHIPCSLQPMRSENRSWLTNQRLECHVTERLVDGLVPGWIVDKVVKWLPGIVVNHCLTLLMGAGIIPTGWLTAPINIKIAGSMFGNKSMLACLTSWHDMMTWICQCFLITSRSISNRTTIFSSTHYPLSLGAHHLGIWKATGISK